MSQPDVSTFGELRVVAGPNRRRDDRSELMYPRCSKTNGGPLARGGPLLENTEP